MTGFSKALTAVLLAASLTTAVHGESTTPLIFPLGVVPNEHAKKRYSKVNTDIQDQASDRKATFTVRATEVMANPIAAFQSSDLDSCHLIARQAAPLTSFLCGSFLIDVQNHSSDRAIRTDKTGVLPPSVT